MGILRLPSIIFSEILEFLLLSYALWKFLQVTNKFSELKFEICLYLLHKLASLTVKNIDI